jgi:hypothetical protein
MDFYLVLFMALAKGAGLADFIQPGLIQLQPNLDDISFMDTLEPLHGTIKIMKRLFLSFNC